jgi:hypothetical protein
MSASVSWSVSNTSVGFITTAEDGTGVFEGLNTGMTRVILSVDGVDRDYSGQVLVLSASTHSSGGGGCGITSLPGDPYITGLVEMMLVGSLLFIMRRKWLAMKSA